MSLALLATPVTLIPAVVIHLAGWPLLLGLGSVGAGVGAAGGAVAGAPAGAAAKVPCRKRNAAKKRISWEQEILRSPEKQREAIAAYRKDPVVEKS